jgi:hypothetical protein
VSMDFDEIVGSEPAGGERDRLREVHDLLVTAGPPPELSPTLAAGPTLALTLPQRVRRRPKAMLLLAATFAVLVAAAIGFGGGGGSHALRAIQLHGTKFAPNSQATLEVLQPQEGNWPMRLDVSGLPTLAGSSHYVVYLVRAGHILAPCGTFVVTTPGRELSLTLNAPYAVEAGDTWIVTRQAAGQTSPGQTVMRPVRA